MVLVQSQSAQGTQDGSTPITLAFPGAVTAGNIIIAFVVNETDGTTSTLDPSLSDTNSNSYSRIDQAYDYNSSGSASSQASIYWATGVAGGSTTVSFDFSGTTSTPGNFNARPYSIVIAEFSPASTLVAHNHGASTSATADAGSVTSSTSNSLFLAVAGANHGVTTTVGTPTGYTSIASDTNAGASSTVMAYNAVYKVGSGTNDAQFSLGSSQIWGAVAGVVVTPITTNTTSLGFFAG